MATEMVGEPWRAFLDELDGLLETETELHCMGGFALVNAYGLARATVDIDVLPAVGDAGLAELRVRAGKDSVLRQQHGVYLDFVTIATVPENYRERLVPLFAGRWQRLRLFALEAHDVALSKLERNLDRDRGDVAHLARMGYLHAAVLQERFEQEMRPYLIGRVSWHEQTLAMWKEAFFSQR